MKKLRLIGSGLILTAMALAWIFFSWKLVLVLLLVLTGNNIEQRCNNAESVGYMDFQRFKSEVIDKLNNK